MIILGGCYGAKYIYDPGTNFSGLKSYAWTTASGPDRKESLVVTNIKFVADQVLEQKGFKKTSENPDLLISIGNMSDTGVDFQGTIKEMKRGWLWTQLWPNGFLLSIDI
jgi:Domain of unknown function (DUF4136)